MMRLGSLLSFGVLAFYTGYRGFITQDQIVWQISQGYMLTSTFYVSHVLETIHSSSSAEFEVREI